jgi:SH3-like domain-containing protein
MRWGWLFGSVLVLAGGTARAAMPTPPIPPAYLHAPSQLGVSRPAAPPVVPGHPLLPLPPRPPGVTQPPAKPEAAKPVPQAGQTPSAKPAPAEAAKDTPPPHWESLRANEVYLRQGPGMQYPIRWVYHRRGLPVEVLRDFDVWRLVIDPAGERGWVHEATLMGTRTFMVTSNEVLMRADASDTARAVAKLEQGVTGKLRACPAGPWCRVSAGGYDGWVQRSAIFGVGPDEVVK